MLADFEFMKLLSKVLAISLVFAAAASFGIALTHATWEVSSIWPANGLLVGILFQRRKTAWGPILVSVAIGGIVANLWLRLDLASALIFTGGDLLEVALVWAALRRSHAPASAVSSPEGLLQFLVLVALLPSAMSGVFVGVLSHAILHWPALTVALTWIRGDSLGLAVFLPIGFVARRTFRAWTHQGLRVGWPRRCARRILAHAIVLAISVCVFGQGHYISTYWALPSIVLAVLWAGSYAAITGTFLAAAVAVITTVNHPLRNAFGSFHFPADAILQVQGFTLACVLASYLMAAVLSDRQRYLRRAWWGHKRQLELADHLRAANEELKTLAHLDPLTGLANRRSFNGSLAHAINQARADVTVLGVMFVDIDWFKCFNDCYGHVEGDEALCKVATALRDSFLEDCAVARIGGEEFAIVIPQTDAATLLRLARLVVQRIYDLSISHRGSPYGRLTISVGVAASDTTRDANAAHLLSQADSAMYQAKRDGRNGYVISLE